MSDLKRPPTTPAKGKSGMMQCRWCGRTESRAVWEAARWRCSCKMGGTVWNSLRNVKVDWFRAWRERRKAAARRLRRVEKEA